MISQDIIAIEMATRAAWPCLERHQDGSWEQRFARGYSNRANSIQCLDPADGADAEMRLAAMVNRARNTGAAPVFRVTPLTAPEILPLLGAQNWQPFGHSLVLAMPLSHDYAAAENVTYLAPDSDVWLDAEAGLQSYSAATRETLSLITRRMDCPATAVLVRDAGGVPVAAALAAVANGYGVYLNVVTSPAHRRQGLGRVLMQAALAWTREQGAAKACIQVSATNDAAVGLYKSLGFSLSHRYHYERLGSAA